MNLPEEVREISMDAQTAAAVRAWGLMGQRIDWGGIEAVALYLAIDDVELLLMQLEEIKNHG